MYQYLFSLIFFISLIPCDIFAQEKDWLQYYDSIKENSIKDRFVKHREISILLSRLKEDERFAIRQLGESIEERAIYSIQIGNGARKILLWSQMHGDEPTATMAIMDLLNFFKNRSLAENWKQEILSELTIYIIPMLNPDGAERFNRRNAVFIDLNRDALRLQSQEAKILKRMVDSIQPEFGFNLHDQSRYYAAGYDSDSTATFSFLAPAFNRTRDINKVRLKSMKLIGSLNDYVQAYLPGKVGRYNDTFEPRAFGDNIMQWGSSTVLIECGGLKGDPEKQQIRKIHFGLLLNAFDCIANNCYEEYTIKHYRSIPSNSRHLHDLILRNIVWKKGDHSVIVDFAFRRNEIEVNDHNSMSYRGQLVDIGDLSTVKAYELLDADSLRVVPPKIYPERIEKSSSELIPRWRKLVREGYAVFYAAENKIPITSQQGPIHWISYGEGHNDWQITYMGNPTFYLSDSESGELKYLVNNGQLYHLNSLAFSSF